METTIYYFTGTGNSLKVARDLSGNLDDCELIPIAKVWQNENIVSTSKKVGIVFPLYYYGLPKIISDFLNKTNFEKTDYIFTVITMGGEWEGVSLKQLEKILRAKSKTLNAGFLIPMPNNFIFDQDVYPKDQEKEMLEKSRIQIANIAESIKKNIHNMEIDINQKRGRSIEKLNTTFHNEVNESDKHFLVNENCNNCGVCEKVCPVNNIILVEGKPQWQHKCQQCLACINFCPEEAIHYGKKTLGRGRYHHPDITVKDLINQKQ